VLLVLLVRSVLVDGYCANLKNTTSLFVFELLFFPVDVQKSSLLSTSTSLFAFLSTAVWFFVGGVRTPSLYCPLSTVPPRGGYGTFT